MCRFTIGRTVIVTVSAHHWRTNCWRMQKKILFLLAEFSALLIICSARNLVLTSTVRNNFV